MKESIAVLGSINMDLVAQVKEFPRPGETIQGFDFTQLPGGKGANQSVAAAKLGSDVHMFGLLGNDLFADTLQDHLQESGVEISALERREISSGLALIMVDQDGENEIVVVGGANGELDDDYIDRYLEKIEDVDVLLLQLEVPVSTVRYLLKRLSSPGPIVVLDPAPARALSQLDFPLDKIDVWTPNETELEILVNESRDDVEMDKTDRLIGEGVNKVIVTRSEEGVTYSDGEKVLDVPSYEVNSVDTTAAGDAFNGALGVALAREYDYRRALRFATAAGALATTKKGAQPSMPTEPEILNLLEESSKASSKS